MANEKQKPKVFNREDGSQFWYVPEESTANKIVWVQTEVVSEITLTQEENQKACSLGFDLDKVLKVKKALLAKKTPTEIQNSLDVSRDSVYRYKKILSLKDTKKAPKDSQKTSFSESVFSMLLIFNDSDTYNTMPLYVVVVPIVVLLLFGYLKREWDTVKNQRIQHHEETKNLYYLMRLANDYSFQRFPLFAYNDADIAYYNKVLEHYNNQSRMVALVENNLDVKDQFDRDFGKANALYIKRAQERARSNWKELEDRGLLDYLYHSRKYKGNWERSKEYMERVTEFLVKNPEPNSAKDHARKKHIIDLME